MIVRRGFGPEGVRPETLDAGTCQVGVDDFAVGPLSLAIVVVIRDDESGRADAQNVPFPLRTLRAVMKVVDLKT
jgi:hypothetical protein